MDNPVFSNSQMLTYSTSLQFEENAQPQVPAEVQVLDKNVLFNNKTEPEPGLAASEHGEGESGENGEYGPNSDDAVELTSRNTECTEAATYLQEQVNVDDDGDVSELSPQTLDVPGVPPEGDHDKSVSSRQTLDSDVDSIDDSTNQGLSESGLTPDITSAVTPDFTSGIITSDTCVRQEENVSKHSDDSDEASVVTVIQGLDELEVQSEEEVNLKHDVQHNQATGLHTKSTASSKTKSQFQQLQQYWKEVESRDNTAGSLGSS